MLKRFLIAAMLVMAACQSAAPTETLTITPKVATTTPRWLETQMNGVSLGLWRPAGWETDLSQGLVIAEHTVVRNGIIESGLLIYCFVPVLDEFHITPSDVNYAWAVLAQVVTMPNHTGSDVAVSRPAGFSWDHYPAAYYLLTSGDGVRALVIALVVPNTQEVVVCNVSVPVAQVSRIRSLTPQLLDGLSINGIVFDGAALNDLPDPLPFPRYTLTSTAVDNRVSSGNPP